MNLHVSRGRASDQDYRTPKWLFARLNAEFNFQLDAACSIENRLAPFGMTQEPGGNGLVDPWLAVGSVWLNPPFRNIEPWVRVAIKNARWRTVVMLLPADPSTGWWNLVAQHATQIRFVSRRLTFTDATGRAVRAPSPSAILVFSSAGGPPSYSYIDRSDHPTLFNSGAK